MHFVESEPEVKRSTVMRMQFCGFAPPSASWPAMILWYNIRSVANYGQHSTLGIELLGIKERWTGLCRASDLQARDREDSFLFGLTALFPTL